MTGGLPGEAAHRSVARGHPGSGARGARPARARRRLQAGLRHPGQPWLLGSRRSVRREVPGPVYVLRIRAAGVQPTWAGRRPGVHGRTSRGGGEQARQPRHVHHALRAVRGDVRPGAGGAGLAAPLLRRGGGVGATAVLHLFFVEGGALAVENALKTAFDWKSRRNEAAGRPAGLGGKVLHLTRAFHGRSGYTLSLTNTDPAKTDRFPKFDWPRIDVPAVRFPLADHRDEGERARRSSASG